MSTNGGIGSIYGGGGGGGGLYSNYYSYTIPTKGDGTAYAYANTPGPGGLGANGAVIVTYVPVTQPTITSVSPNNGYSSNTVIITGTQFINVTNVNFNAVSASFVVTNTTQIIATVPAYGNLGSVNISVYNLVANSAISSADIFTYNSSTFNSLFMGFAF